MSSGLRLSLLLLWLAGCASQRLVVPDEDWQTVPAKQRTAVDARHQADLAAARAELAAATAELAAFRRSHPTLAAPAPATPASAQPLASRDDWDNAVRDHEQARRVAFVRVEDDKAAWLRADLAWRELHLETATARIDLVTCEREMVRARTIDRNLLGTDSYDSAPLRGQFSRAQQRWYQLSTRAAQARDALERASRSLASSKETYAQLMRNGPAQLRSVPAFAADEHPRRLELTAWAVTRSDIRRRRGLRHYLDTAASAPAGLRRANVRLAARAVVLPPPAPPSTGVAVNDPPPAPPPVAAKPAPPLVAAKPAPPPVAVKPAPTAVASPTAVTAKPSPVAAKPLPSPVAAKPSPPPVAAKPAPPPSPVAAKPAPPPSPVAAKPALPPPVAAKPAPALPTAAAKPAPPPSDVAKPVTPPASLMFPSPSSAAKPAEPEPSSR